MTKMLIIPLVLVATFIAGVQYFAHAIRDLTTPELTPYRDQTGVVVATGHEGRLAAGLELMTQNLASRMLISGVGQGIDKADLRHVAKVSSQIDDVFLCCVDLGHKATDTEGNALEAKEWAEGYGLQTLIIVTSDFHMPRTMIAFEQYFAENRLIAHHVKTSWLQLDKNGRSGWWRTPARISLIAGEMVKYLTRTLT